MRKMKCQIAIYLDIEQIEILGEIKNKYHLKSISAATELIIKQWQMFIEQRINEQKNIKKKPAKPLISPYALE